jgi:hypothetical protein
VFFCLEWKSYSWFVEAGGRDVFFKLDYIVEKSIAQFGCRK